MPSMKMLLTVCSLLQCASRTLQRAALCDEPHSATILATSCNVVCAQEIDITKFTNEAEAEGLIEALAKEQEYYDGEITARAGVQDGDEDDDEVVPRAASALLCRAARSAVAASLHALS